MVVYEHRQVDLTQSNTTYLRRKELEPLIRLALRARAVKVHEVGVDALAPLQ